MAGQLWVTDSIGGYMHSVNLSKKLRTAVQPRCKFRQFSDIKDATMQGLHHGDTFHWNRFSDVATQGTTLTETTVMPESNFTITQGTLTMVEMGNSVPYSGVLDDLSEQPVTEVINKVLKNDATKAIDSQAASQFGATPLRIAPTGGTSASAVTLTTNGTATITNNVALGKAHVSATVDTMKERNIPPYMADDYYAIARPTALRALKDDLETIHQYTEQGLGMIFRGEIGRYDSCRFVEQTNTAAGGLGTAGAAWGNGNDWVCFFGEDTVAEAVAIPEEIRGKIPTDYGRSKGVAWYAILGYGLTHTDADQARVVLWDSAA